MVSRQSGNCIEDRPFSQECTFSLTCGRRVVKKTKAHVIGLDNRGSAPPLPPLPRFIASLNIRVVAFACCVSIRGQEMDSRQRRQRFPKLFLSRRSEKGTLSNIPKGGNGANGQWLLNKLKKDYPDGRNAVMIMTTNNSGGKSWQTWFSTVSWKDTGSGQDWAWQGGGLGYNKDEAKNKVTITFPATTS